MQSIIRVRSPQIFTSVDDTVEADRLYFELNPEATEYIRDFVPGEFGLQELPKIPPGFTYATIVEPLWRDGAQIGRTRRLMAVIDRRMMQQHGR